MDKKLLLFILVVPFIGLLSWTIWLYTQQMSGQEIKVAVSGYDPRDLLSGRYIEYTIDWNRTDCTQFADGICPKDEFCKEASLARVCRFYIPEEKAEQLTRLFWKRNTTDMVFEVVYSYHKGAKPLAKQLLINGRDWQESLDEVDNF